MVSGLSFGVTQTANYDAGQNKRRSGTVKSLPVGVMAYSRTQTYSEEGVPSSLLEAHTIKAGVWALIVVEQGRLQYDMIADGECRILGPGAPGVIEPETVHKVTPIGAVDFHISFYR